MHYPEGIHNFLSYTAYYHGVRMLISDDGTAVTIYKHPKTFGINDILSHSEKLGCRQFGKAM